MSLGGTVKRKSRGDGFHMRPMGFCIVLSVGNKKKSSHHLLRNSWPMGTHWTNFYVSSENAWASSAPLLFASPQHAQVGLTSGGNFISVAPSAPVPHHCTSSLSSSHLPSTEGSETWPSPARGKYLTLDFCQDFISNLCLWAFLWPISDWEFTYNLHLIYLFPLCSTHCDFVVAIRSVALHRLKKMAICLFNLAHTRSL